MTEILAILVIALAALFGWRSKQSGTRLEYLAHHDALTGLPNRLFLDLRLEHALGRARRNGETLALLLLDLDRFKDVNDSFGHSMGDRLLEQVSARLTARLRDADTVSRLGGDEFVLLLESLRHPEDAARVADELIDAISEPYLLPNGHEVLIGVSIGIALFPDHGGGREELLQHADAALYRAKADGRDRFMFFSEEMTVTARARVALEMRLHQALARNELRLHFQPQIDMASGRIIGAEALVRWQDPEDGGLVLPEDFIPLAEETGLINAIGRWVLTETCRQGRRWRDAGMRPLTLAVNVSPRQLRHGDFVAVVAETLAETGYPADGLELELTESALAENPGALAEIFQRLRALGVRLVLDGFGAGHSSLARLKRLPLDVLKIDKSFVADIPRDRNGMEIIATIIAMGKTMRMRVLAEGVETAEQLDFLEKQGCREYQGYYLSRPLPPEEFARFVETSASNPMSPPCPAGSPQREGGGILVVDDEPMNFLIIRHLLEHMHYAVRAALDGESALAEIEALPPDLILMDIMMPGMDGYEVCQRLQVDTRFRDIPVIFISSLGDAEAKMRGFEVGGVDYISKPFDAGEVMTRVRTHMTLRHCLRDLDRASKELRRLDEVRLGLELCLAG